MAWRRLLPDPFIGALLGTVALASVLPCAGVAAHGLHLLTNAAIALLFFLHGAKLSRASVLAGLANWRLHLFILASTFVLFPLVALLCRALLSAWVTPSLYMGVLFLACLPSTVQSSIAFTSIAGGEVPAAVCAASASSLLGIFVTPLLAGLLVHTRGGGISPAALYDIVLQLLVPFVLGQAVQRRIGHWVAARRALLAVVDRGSILLVVYTAFSAAVLEGLWRRVPPSALFGVLTIDGILLATALLATWRGARLAGFGRGEQIVAVFCGSKKSLASGIPIANILFPGPALGMIVLPLMLFHPLQLFVCAVLARRYARAAPNPPGRDRARAA